MKKKILEIKDPIIKCYTNYGLLFSILPNNMIPWVYNNFLQIRYSTGWNIVTFDNHHMLLSHCPGISFRTIPQNFLIKGFNGNIKAIIFEAINSNQYIFMYLDRFYLKAADRYYNKIHFSHEIFIYGYDLENDIVYFADNLQHDKFSFMITTFCELEQAYNAVNHQYDFMTDIGILTVYSWIESSIDMNQIADGLDRYINSKPTFDMRYEQPCEFGLSVYQTIIDKFVKNKKEKIDIRPFHLLYEHKLLMKMRVDYLMNNHLLTKNIDIKSYTKLVNNFLILRNMVIKYNLTMNIDLVQNIIRKLDQLKEEEIVLLQQLYLDIKNQ